MADSLQITRVNAFHEALALYIIQNPRAKLKEMAQHFRCSPQWISIVRNSDAFKVYYAERMDKQFDAVGDIIDQTKAMTAMALELMNEKLESIGTELSIGELKDIADTGLKRLGYGARASAPVVQVNAAQGVVVVSRGELAAARERMERVHGAGSSPKQIAAPQDLTAHAETVD